jgi:hypothetical protein
MLNAIFPSFSWREEGPKGGVCTLVESMKVTGSEAHLSLTFLKQRRKEREGAGRKSHTNPTLTVLWSKEKSLVKICWPQIQPETKLLLFFIFGCRLFLS